MKPKASRAAISELRRRLRPGQILTARVVNRRTDGSWDITLAGVILPFSSSETLQVGERIILMVERRLPTIRLKQLGRMRDGGIDGRM